MFALNLLLILQGSPEAYGHFILVLGLYFLAFGAQHAVILLPVNVLLPGKPHSRQNITLRMLSNIDLVLISVAALLVGAMALAFELSIMLSLAGFGLVITMSARELARTVFLTRQQPKRLIILDAVFIAGTWLALPLLWSSAQPEEAATLALVIGNSLAFALAAPKLYRRTRTLRRSWSRYSDYWRKSRWALVGAGLTEAQLRLYIFVVELARGSAALGLLHAGRVIINPISMVAFAWCRAIRPMVALHLERQEEPQAFRLIGISMVGLLTFAVLYLLALYAAWPLLETRLFVNEGEAFARLVALWAIFGMVNVPSIVLSIYLQAKHRYRDLTAITAISVTTSALLLASLFFEVDLSLAIIALLAGEAIMIVCLCAVLWFDVSAIRRGVRGAHV